MKDLKHKVLMNSQPTNCRRANYTGSQVKLRHVCACVFSNIVLFCFLVASEFAGGQVVFTGNLSTNGYFSFCIYFCII